MTIRDARVECIKEDSAMKRIKFNFATMLLLVLADKAKFIILMMTGNAFFTTPAPALADVLAKVNELLVAITKAEQGTKADKQERDDLGTELVILLNQLGYYVMNIAAGKEQVLLSSGFDLENDRTPIGPLGQVLNVNAKMTGVEGAIDLKWKKLRGAKFYTVQVTTTPEVAASWTQLAIVPRSRVLLTEMPSLQVRYFRVAGTGTAGQGPWSEVADGVAR